LKVQWLIYPPKGGRKHPQQEYIQIDTSNVLFICGGAFVGLEEIVERRFGETKLGFNAEVRSKKDRNLSQLMEDVRAEDLLKFGLIPEFIGRLPVLATLGELDEEALVNILSQPKNALVKQYCKLFEFENVELSFTDEALKAIAKEALERKSGARGLRAIMEDVMLDIMYDIPSQDSIREVIINEDCVKKRERPLVVYEKEVESA